jgi:hypothetical protein
MLKLAIETTNAAFEGDPAPECARILRAIADALEDGSTGGPIRDVNGNRVGTFTIKRGR